MKPFQKFNLDFANYTISSCLFFFFLIIDFLPLVIVAQIYHPIEELVIFKGILTKEPKAEMESAKTTIRKCLMQVSEMQAFLFLLLICSCWSISLMNFLFFLCFLI